MRRDVMTIIPTSANRHRVRRYDYASTTMRIAENLVAQQNLRFQFLKKQRHKIDN